MSRLIGTGGQVAIAHALINSNLTNIRINDAYFFNCCCPISPLCREPQSRPTFASLLETILSNVWTTSLYLLIDSPSLRPGSPWLAVPSGLRLASSVANLSGSLNSANLASVLGDRLAQRLGRAYLRGSSTVKQAPSPSRLSTVMLPPIRSTRDLTIASPNPVPPWSRVMP